MPKKLFFAHISQINEDAIIKLFKMNVDHMMMMTLVIFLKKNCVN